MKIAGVWFCDCDKLLVPAGIVIVGCVEGIVNLDGRGMLVVSVARRLGSEGPLLAYRAARL